MQKNYIPIFISIVSFGKIIWKLFDRRQKFARISPKHQHTKVMCHNHSSKTSLDEVYTYFMYACGSTLVVWPSYYVFQHIFSQCIHHLYAELLVVEMHLNIVHSLQSLGSYLLWNKWYLYIVLFCLEDPLWCGASGMYIVFSLDQLTGVGGCGRQNTKNWSEKRNTS